ncbi:MAG TPA: hypothetical protein VN420_01455 [Candidatus Fimivivens sp.]|nr:hypothetical protein [Candidatus Fimivivens sp.]
MEQEKVKIGQKVRISPGEYAPEDLKMKVNGLGGVEGEVSAVTGIGVCTVLLPKGVEIPGYSHPLGGGVYYADLHCSFLAQVDDEPESGV